MGSWLGHPLFIAMVIGGLTTATGVFGFFARQVMLCQRNILTIQAQVDSHLRRFDTETALSRNDRVVNTKKLEEVSIALARMEENAKSWNGNDRRRT